MAETIDVKVKEIIQFLNLLSADEQDRILRKIQKSLSPKRKLKAEKKRKPLLFPSPKISIAKLKGNQKGVPSIGDVEEFVKKHAATKEKLQPLKELFKDGPSAEELKKMLTK